MNLRTIIIIVIFLPLLAQQVWGADALLEQAFIERGGTFYRPEHKSADKQFFTDFRFELKENDLIFPICSAGINRSQVLYRLLSNFKTKGLHIDLIDPHGADKAHDPFLLDDGKKTCHKKFITYIKDRRSFNPEILEKNGNLSFLQTFGTIKQNRFGSQEAQKAYGKSDTPAIHTSNAVYTFFNDHYFKRNNNMNGRRIFITFGPYYKIIIKRLLTTHPQKDSLKNTIVINLMLYDLTESQSLKIESTKAYLVMYAAYRHMFYSMQKNSLGTYIMPRIMQPHGMGPHESLMTFVAKKTYIDIEKDLMHDQGVCS